MNPSCFMYVFAMMKISFVLPIYNEQDNIPILYGKLRDIVTTLWVDHEMVFVNDWSQDDSLNKLIDLHASDPKVKVIDLARNFWHERALTAGLDRAEGDYIVIMDADMQDPPETIIPMFQKLNEGYDVVYAKRKLRHDGWMKNTASNLFYRFINKLSEVPMPLDTGNFRIFTKQVLTEIRRFHEQSRFIRWMFAWLGFSVAAVEFERTQRIHGKTGYGWFRLFKLGMDAVFSFSNIPLKIATILWTIFSLFGFILGLYYLIERLLHPDRWVWGIPTLVVVVCFIGGIQLLMLWVVGEYISRIYKETKWRPLYIVKKVY